MKKCDTHIQKYIGSSERLGLRKISTADFDFLLELFNDPLAMQFYPEKRNAEKTRSWIEFTLRNYELNGYGKWMIEIIESGECIGHSGLVPTEIDGVEEIELGYFLHPKFWHRGFATEAAKICLNVAFQNIGLKRVVSAINPANTPSIMVAERLGMKREKNATARVGEYVWNCDVYAMDFENSDRSKLVGRWSLESYENFLPSGGSIHLSEGQSGSLEYTRDGEVRVSIKRDAIQLKSLGLSPRLASIQYKGRYEIDETKHSVSHHIEECNEADRNGKVMTRQYALTEDRLEITGIGLEGKVKLSWKRER